MNDTLLKVAIKASIEAGNEIMAIYARDFNIEYKRDESPVTDGDLASNTVLISYLRPTEIPIISEESKQLDYNIRKNWKQCWIIDPLDGTKEFIKKNNEFTVNVALVQDGKPKLGVIYAPALNTLYYADVEGKKAYKSVITNDFDLDKAFQNESDLIQPVSISQSSIKVVASRSHLNSDTQAFIDNLKCQYDEVETVSKGSSLKFCLVAEGKADVYPRYAPTMEWDTAAGQAICEAVGLEVLDLKTMRSMMYNREDLLNNYFLVRSNDPNIP